MNLILDTDSREFSVSCRLKVIFEIGSSIYLEHFYKESTLSYRFELMMLLRLLIISNATFIFHDVNVATVDCAGEGIR